MRSFFRKTLLSIALAGLSACSKSGKNFSPGDVILTGRSQVSPPEHNPSQAAVFAPNGVSGLENIKITPADAVATDDVGKQLGVAPGIIVKGDSFAFRSAVDIPLEALEQAEFQIPFKDGLTDNMVVMYRLLPVGDQPAVVGIIPLSYLTVDAEKSLVTFKTRGLGDYQVAHTPEKIVKPLTTDTLGTTPIVSGRPPVLELAGMFSLTDYYGMDATATHAFVIGDTGLRVINIADPNNLSQVGVVSNANGEFGAGRALRLAANLAVQVTSTAGEGVFNITNPTAPSFRGAGGNAQGRDLVIIGNYGFAATANGLQPFLYTNAIMQQDPMNQTGGCNGVDGDNRILAAACANTIVGVVTARLPFAAGFTIAGNAGGRSVAVAGNFVYVVGDDGLRIYEVPQQPLLQPTRLVGTLARPGAVSVAVSGNFAIVVTGTDATTVDITDKTAPKLVNPNAVIPLTNGRRVRLIPGVTDKALLLDSTGLKVVLMR